MVKHRLKIEWTEAAPLFYLKSILPTKNHSWLDNPTGRKIELNIQMLDFSKNCTSEF
jgi:hypothetical protein